MPVVALATESARRLYVFIDPSNDGRGPVQLRMSTLRAHRFVTIGPHLPRDFFPDSMFALDRLHLWFTMFSDGGGRERLYRTNDGGSTWHWTPIASHSMAGGSTDALWFTDADHGWLTDIQPTAPDAMLFVTADGGRRWHAVADTKPHEQTRTLPTIAPVAVPAGRDHGMASRSGVLPAAPTCMSLATAARHGRPRSPRNTERSLRRVSSAAKCSSPSAGAQTAPAEPG